MSVLLEYKAQWDLRGVHTDNITGVAISPRGDYVATCSTDCQIVIWSLNTGQAAYHITAQSAVLSVIWTEDPDVIVTGTADGTLVTMTLTPVCGTPRC